MDQHVSPFGELLRTFRKRKGMTQQTVAMHLGVHRNTIGFWERGNVLPDTKAIVLELADVLGLSDMETRQLLEASMTSLPPYQYLPFPRTPFFLERGNVLSTLHHNIMASAETSLALYALQGLGGVGKTQIALEYAYRHSFDYSALLWVEAETPEKILASFRQIAGVLQLPGRQEVSPQHVVEAVRYWLSSHTQWLLIWDNLDDLDLLLRFLPPLQQGVILLTTRNQLLSPAVQGMELLPMTKEEGIRFLLRRTKVLGTDASSKQVCQFAEHLPAQYAAVEEIVRMLGGLPLALDQAGTYIEETGCSFSDYVQHYQQHPIRLLDRRGMSGGEHPLAVDTLFRLAKENVEQEMKMAADMLRVLAVVQAPTISEKFFLEGAEYLGPELEALATDPFQLDLAIAVLRRFSLVQRCTQERVLSFHPLVQVVIYEHMSPQEREVWHSRVVATCNAMNKGAGCVLPDRF